jgi:hypothetical protein
MIAGRVAMRDGSCANIQRGWPWSDQGVGPKEQYTAPSGPLIGQRGQGPRAYPSRLPAFRLEQYQLPPASLCDCPCQRLRNPPDHFANHDSVLGCSTTPWITSSPKRNLVSSGMCQGPGPGDSETSPDCIIGRGGRPAIDLMPELVAHRRCTSDRLQRLWGGDLHPSSMASQV